MRYDRNQFEPPIDLGVERAVLILKQHDIETYESCQGGEGYAYPEPTVALHGIYADAIRALSIAIAHGMPASEFRRVWGIADGELVGPQWNLVFSKPEPLSNEEISGAGLQHTPM